MTTTDGIVEALKARLSDVGQEGTDKIAWVLEPDVFSDESYRSMRDAVVAQGHEFVAWSDEWWTTGRWPRLTERSVVFHGSLGNAALVRQTFCRVRLGTTFLHWLVELRPERFRCSFDPNLSSTRGTPSIRQNIVGGWA